MEELLLFVLRKINNQATISNYKIPALDAVNFKEISNVNYFNKNNLANMKLLKVSVFTKPEKDTILINVVNLLKSDSSLLDEINEDVFVNKINNGIETMSHEKDSAS